MMCKLVRLLHHNIEDYIYTPIPISKCSKPNGTVNSQSIPG